jgi:hypothetical protein
MDKIRADVYGDAAGQPRTSFAAFVEALLAEGEGEGEFDAKGECGEDDGKGEGEGEGAAEACHSQPSRSFVDPDSENPSSCTTTTTTPATTSSDRGDATATPLGISRRVWILESARCHSASSLYVHSPHTHIHSTTRGITFCVVLGVGQP